MTHLVPTGPFTRGGAMIADLDAIAALLRGALAADPPRLDRIALAIAQLDDTPFDAAAVIALLDDWGDRVRAAAHGSLHAGVDVLERLLAREVGLRGDVDDYDDPRNSFLPRVLERRRGLPILLSIVYLEVARRADLPLYGLALPGHFVVAYDLDDERAVVLDPFAGARILTRPELAAIVEAAGARLEASMFKPASARTIAVRMLRNLVASYRRRGHGDKLRAAATLLLVLEPTDATTQRALSEAEAATGDDQLN